MDDNESYYGGGSEPATTDDSPAGQDQGDSGKETALINSSICPGMKPGDKLELTIESVLDSGEYEVSYTPTEKSEGESESIPETPTSSDSEMASYMQ